MKILIKVTKEIIAQTAMCGISDDLKNIASNCAIAVAVRDLIPDALVLDDYEICCSRLDTIITLPPVAEKFIIQFDGILVRAVTGRDIVSQIELITKQVIEERMRLQPVEFEVDLPDEFIDLISIDEVKRIVNASPTLELV